MQNLGKYILALRFIFIYVMNLPTNLKIKKVSQQTGHRRTKTDYANVKKLVDNFTKQPVADQALKPIKYMQLGAQIKQKTFKLQHNRGNKSTLGQTYLVTEYQEKGGGKKNDVINVKVDYPVKKFQKNLQPKQAIRATQAQGSQKIVDRYEWEVKVGAGTFGTVHKARDRKTLEIVAIKKVFQDKKYKNRELQILKTLKHSNVLEMRDHFFTYQGDKQYLNVVMQYFPSNLFDYIQSIKSKKFSKLKFKVIAFQLFRALLYLQQKRIAHRDIKPQNILIRDTDLKVVICDFGSAKILVPGEENISYICSRCYRAPQLIFQNTQYSTQIDVWSTGCVLIQILTGVPIFRANSNLEQLIQIMKFLGTPNHEDIYSMNPDCDIQKFQLPRVPKKQWHKVLKSSNMGDQFFDLLDKIMRYSPKQRFTPSQALQHKFFDELRLQSIYEHLRTEMRIPELFNFSQQLQTTKYDNLVPKWFNEKRKYFD